MRIIAGEFRGRKLLPPDGDVTRPITDRVKQSLFDILTPLLPDARVHDCFAGTGSLGLESLSRGAAHVTFFEQHRPAIARLRRNIDALGVASRARVIAQDLFKWFESSPPPTARVDIIFVDPPYRFLTEEADKLRHLATQIATNHMTTDGLLVFRHDAGDELILPGLERRDRRDYGGMVVECFGVTVMLTEPANPKKDRLGIFELAGTVDYYSDYDHKAVRRRDAKRIPKTQ